jgi:hypothetical protein
MGRRFGVLALIVLAGMMIFSQGCASIMGGSKQTVSITSQPSGAAYTIYNKKGQAIDSGTTPATVTLKAGAGYFSPQKYTVKLAKAGCRECEAPIEHGISGWYIGGNLIFGGLVGYLVVDPLTGAMWTLKDCHVEMDSEPRTQMMDDTLKIVTLDQVPSVLRQSMVRIN